MARWLVQFPDRARAEAALTFLNGARLGTNIVYAQKVGRVPAQSRMP